MRKKVVISSVLGGAILFNSCQKEIQVEPISFERESFVDAQDISRSYFDYEFYMSDSEMEKIRQLDLLANRLYNDHTFAKKMKKDPENCLIEYGLENENIDFKSNEVHTIIELMANDRIKKALETNNLNDFLDEAVKLGLIDADALYNENGEIRSGVCVAAIGILVAVAGYVVVVFEVAFWGPNTPARALETSLINNNVLKLWVEKTIKEGDNIAFHDQTKQSINLQLDSNKHLNDHTKLLVRNIMNSDFTD